MKVLLKVLSYIGLRGYSSIKIDADNAAILAKSLQFLNDDDKLKINKINNYKKIASPRFDEEYDTLGFICIIYPREKLIIVTTNHQPITIIPNLLSSFQLFNGM